MLLQSTTQESLSQFENLPTEVLLQILVQISDIHCLWNLLISSPIASHIFNQYSNDIFWPAISNSIVPSQTQDIIRCIVSLRAGAFRNTPLDHLVRKIRDREAGIVLGQSSDMSYSFPTMDSARIPSLDVLRSVLATASRIHAMSRLCISHYLDRLLLARAEGRLEESSQWPKSDRLSWVEEQRIIRAFWRIQLVFELRLAARTSQVRNSPQHVKELNDLDIGAFYDSSTSNLKAAYHEVMTVLEYLRGTKLFSGVKTVTLLGRIPSPDSSPESIAPSTIAMPVTSATRGSALVLPADGLWIVDSMARNTHSPIKYAGFQPYRSLGFAIWDRDRLARLGLASPPGQGRVTGLGSYFSFWVRLLSPQDINRAEKRMREAEHRGGRLEPLQPMIQDNAS